MEKISPNVLASIVGEHIEGDPEAGKADDFACRTARPRWYFDAHWLDGRRRWTEGFTYVDAKAGVSGGWGASA